MKYAVIIFLFACAAAACKHQPDETPVSYNPETGSLIDSSGTAGQNANGTLNNSGDAAQSAGAGSGSKSAGNGNTAGNANGNVPVNSKGEQYQPGATSGTMSGNTSNNAGNSPSTQHNDTAYKKY